MTIDIFHLFLFVIPGFITVWSFRYFSESKKSGDFEYFALSVFWGLVMLVVYEMIFTKEQISQLIGNPYAAALVFSLLSPFFGFFGSALSKTNWFQRGATWLKNFHF